MRRDIARKSKKWLKTLKSNGFREPYQIVVDNTFLDVVNKNRIQYSVFKSFFRSEPKFIMTSCIYRIHKENMQESRVEGVKDFSGYCEIVKCMHNEISNECTNEFIKSTNLNHYILATNNREKINKLQDNLSIPILRISQCIPRIDCCKMKQNATIHMDEKASKKEIENLKKLFG